MQNLSIGQECRDALPNDNRLANFTVFTRSQARGLYFSIGSQEGRLFEGAYFRGGLIFLDPKNAFLCSRIYVIVTAEFIARYRNKAQQ